MDTPLIVRSGMKQPLRYGRKHMCPQFYVQFSIPTTQLTSLTRIVNSTLSCPAKESYAFFRQLRPYFPRVGTSTSFAKPFYTDLALGWQVGSDPEIQVATVVSNHLTAGIMKYFGDSGRYQPAANLFEKLSVREPEVASLLARSYIGMSTCTAAPWPYQPQCIAAR